jgi:hypothetical protein
MPTAASPQEIPYLPAARHADQGPRPDLEHPASRTRHKLLAIARRLLLRIARSTSLGSSQRS